VPAGRLPMKVSRRWRSRESSRKSEESRRSRRKPPGRTCCKEVHFPAPRGPNRKKERSGRLRSRVMVRLRVFCIQLIILYIYNVILQRPEQKDQGFFLVFTLFISILLCALPLPHFCPVFRQFDLLADRGPLHLIVDIPPTLVPSRITAHDNLDPLRPEKDRNHPVRIG